MVEPTAADVQSWTKLDALKNAAADDAARIVAVAKSSFLKITGQSWTAILPQDEPLVQQAVKGMAELTSYQDSPEYIETLADFDLIQSFSAGPYSETRRSPGDAMKARLLVAWPWLSDMLWNLLTPEKYDYWTAFFSDKPTPAFDVQEMNWGDHYLGEFFDGHVWGA